MKRALKIIKSVNTPPTVTNNVGGKLNALFISDSETFEPLCVNRAASALIRVDFFF